jgi:hypothetical protein
MDEPRLFRHLGRLGSLLAAAAAAYLTWAAFGPFLWEIMR